MRPAALASAAALHSAHAPDASTYGRAGLVLLAVALGGALALAAAGATFRRFTARTRHLYTPARPTSSTTPARPRLAPSAAPAAGVLTGVLTGHLTGHLIDTTPSSAGLVGLAGLPSRSAPDALTSGDEPATATAAPASGQTAKSGPAALGTIPARITARRTDREKS